MLGIHSTSSFTVYKKAVFSLLGQSNSRAGECSNIQEKKEIYLM